MQALNAGKSHGATQRKRQLPSFATTPGEYSLMTTRSSGGQLGYGVRFFVL
jgi:hypothetical protein